ncbi:MAG: hypothetical protein LC745_03945, partial [Planctomycetia bacterium]|nr:hypothetical protein [Planctomycetia bacterium]
AAGGESPAEERVRGLLRDAGAGDVTAYLSAFTGPLRQRLERDVKERGMRAFADDLRAAAKSRKSHAVFTAEPDGDEAARVTVENVYPDRNERQTYRVERKDGGWLVADVETVRSHQPTSKFGAPAHYVAPEGVPVQGALRVDDGADPTAGEVGTGPPD